MKFRTAVEALDYPIRITNGQKIMTIGSCFSEVMGERLKSLPLEVLNQPLGTVFHPLCIIDLLQAKPLQKEFCYTWEGKFVHPLYHSKWKGESADDLIDKIEKKQAVVQSFLQKADWLFITFGTSFYYHDDIFQIRVANCHKQNQKRFTKKRSSLNEIMNAWQPFLGELLTKNPTLNVLFTVSPVRHTKDGIQQNQVSKSILRLAVEELVESHERAYYFPAYEYMLDELRDYQYYKGDLIHPNEEAEEFIYEKLIKFLNLQRI